MSGYYKRTYVAIMLCLLLPVHQAQTATEKTIIASPKQTSDEDALLNRNRIDPLSSNKNLNKDMITSLHAATDTDGLVLAPANPVTSEELKPVPFEITLLDSTNAGDLGPAEVSMPALNLQSEAGCEGRRLHERLSAFDMYADMLNRKWNNDTGKKNVALTVDDLKTLIKLSPLLIEHKSHTLTKRDALPKRDALSKRDLAFERVAKAISDNDSKNGGGSQSESTSAGTSACTESTDATTAYCETTTECNTGGPTSTPSNGLCGYNKTCDTKLPCNLADTLEKILENVDLLSQEKMAAKPNHNQTYICEINGTWITEAGGIQMRIDMSGNLLTIKPERVVSRANLVGFLCDDTWSLSGLLPLARTGFIIINGVNEKDKRVATFIGECKPYSNVPLIWGHWLVGGTTRGRVEGIMSQQMFIDVLVKTQGMTNGKKVS